MKTSYIIVKINNLYFKAPSEWDQDYFDDYDLKDIINPAHDLFKYSQLAEDIKDAYPFGCYRNDLDLPKYALFKNDLNRKTESREDLKKHFQRIYQTEDVQVLDIQKVIHYEVLNKV